MGMFIDGAWIEAGERRPSLNPATGETLAEVGCASPDQVSAAVAAARTSLPGWKSLGTQRRSQLLAQLGEHLREAYGAEGSSSPLKDLITAEVGKRLPEADIEVAESGDMVEYFVREAARVLSPETLSLDGELWPTKESRLLREPVGVVGVIKPWNYPLELPIWSIAPALLAGNTVVFKPAVEASLVGIEIAKMMDGVLPRGVFNLVTGGGEVGRLLVEAEVDLISFTGSVEVGREIASKAAPLFKRCTLELGGNDPALVDVDVDLELAANGLVWGCFANAGQVCVRPKRVLVHQGIADALLDLVRAKTEALRVDVDWGPLISESQLERVSAQVAETVGQGATVVAGGHRLADRAGFYFEPTILDNVDPTMRVAEEECFGPVMPLIRVSSMEEACEIANDTIYGLGASVWTSTTERGEELASRLTAGMVWVNDVNVAFPQAPWGGVKSSGMGSELGEGGLLEYTVPRHLSLEQSQATRRDWWFPY
jgi:acyl-CoA reductase-like NAD-dependent aldehyde dehydrogenase